MTSPTGCIDLVSDAIKNGPAAFDPPCSNTDLAVDRDGCCYTQPIAGSRGNDPVVRPVQPDLTLVCEFLKVSDYRGAGELAHV